MQLTEFNAMEPAAAAAIVEVWAAIPTWVDRVVAGRPYASRSELERSALAASTAWDATSLDAALAHHPRIGERQQGAGVAAAASANEQSAVAAAGEATMRRIAEANEAYERRFGRVFLIRAAGRTPNEILAEAQRRLENVDAIETIEALDQLRQIAALRLRTAIEDAAAA